MPLYYIRDITADDRNNSSTVTAVPFMCTEKAFRSSLEPIWAGYKKENWGIFMGAAILGYWGFFIVIAAF
jgi:hypothetical protein